MELGPATGPQGTRVHLHEKPLPLWCVCGRKRGPHLGTGLPRGDVKFISKHRSHLKATSPAGCMWDSDSPPPHSRQTSCHSFSERKEASPRLLLTSCLILESGALAHQRHGSHIHNPLSGTLQSFPEDPGGQKSAGPRDSPSSVSQEDTTL